MDYKYGYPIAKRKSTINEAQSSETHRVMYRGQYRALRVVELPIELPVYRIENIRTKNLQKEWLKEHPDRPRDTFSADPASIEAQEAQDELLNRLASKEGLLGAFKSTGSSVGMQQTEPIICTDEGVVVNGNRRLCVWRSLYFSQPDKYPHFKTVRVALLPDHDEAGVYELEVALQIHSDMRAEYAWHAIAADCKEKRDRGMYDIPVIATQQGKSIDEINALIECYDHASQYLESIDHADEWSLVDKSLYAFKQIVAGRKSLTNPGDKELFQEIASAMLQQPSTGERLYSQIPKVVKTLPTIAEKLKETFAISVASDGDDPFALLTGGDSGSSDSKTAIIAAGIHIANDPVRVVETVKAVITTVDELEKEKKKKSFIFDQVLKAATALNNALSNLDETMDKKGVDKQIEAIEGACTVLKDWIK